MVHLAARWGRVEVLRALLTHPTARALLDEPRAHYEGGTDSVAGTVEEWVRAKLNFR